LQEVKPGSVTVDLAGDYALTGEQISSYQQNGHILLRQVAAPAEMAVYRPAILEAAYRYNTETRPLSERDTYGKAFLQIMNLWERDEAVRRFVLARRFAKIAADLMGVKGVRIYHDQALFKEPYGGPTPWHQDQYYWPLDTDKFVTMWMPLSDISVEMGPMTFANGSNKLGYLGKIPISDRSQAIFEEFIAKKQLSLQTGSAMAAGDATFHSGWTLHGTPGNSTNRPREAMTIIYFADGAHITDTDNINRVADLERWFPGLKTGDLAASQLNPLVYTS
jgi:ectoine hydroxylase-related dioxygenase (phytanoyl-CoA dioxygenase family)